jgi:hypothetical protein
VELEELFQNAHSESNGLGASKSPIAVVRTRRLRGVSARVNECSRDFRNYCAHFASGTCHAAFRLQKSGRPVWPPLHAIISF